MWRRKLEVPSSMPEWIRKLGINLSDTASDSDESSLEDDDDDRKFSILGGGSSSGDGRKHRRLRRQELRVPPTEGGRPVNPLKVAALFFNNRCQVCGTWTNELDYNLLARVCTSCVDREGVAIGDMADDEALEELHPMATQIVRTTRRKSLKSRERPASPVT